MFRAPARRPTRNSPLTGRFLLEQPLIPQPEDEAEKRLREAPRQDPATPGFWDARYRERFMPWDAGKVPAGLQAFVATLPPAQRVLIPGCGTGYELAAFVAAGHDALAIDFSPAAVAAARDALGPLGDRVRQADFFDFDAGPPFDVIYERAFLCALPRRMWPQYPSRMHALLRPHGLLAGYFFFDEGERGPPFGLRPGELDALLGQRFDRIADAAVADSLPVFAERERWQVWRRRDSGA
jgi:SAM-dependent methyltransferase